MTEGATTPIANGTFTIDFNDWHLFNQFQCIAPMFAQFVLLYFCEIASVRRQQEQQQYAKQSKGGGGEGTRAVRKKNQFFSIWSKEGEGDPWNTTTTASTTLYWLVVAFGFEQFALFFLSTPPTQAC